MHCSAEWFKFPWPTDESPGSPLVWLGMAVARLLNNSSGKVETGRCATAIELGSSRGAPRPTPLSSPEGRRGPGRALGFTRNSPLPSPLPASQGEGEVRFPATASLNSMAVGRCAVRAPCSGATVPPTALRAGASQREVPAKVRFIEGRGCVKSGLARQSYFASPGSGTWPVRLR